MRNLIIAAFSSGSAISPKPEVPQDVNVEVDPNFGIGGRWIIPAVIVAVLALAVLKPGIGQ